MYDQYVVEKRVTVAAYLAIGMTLINLIYMLVFTLIVLRGSP